MPWEQMEEGGDAGRNGNDRGKCLKIRGRRACKKLGMPVTDKGARLIDRRRDADLNQNDDDGRDAHRGSRVHGDAKGAMVGVVGVGVEMRDLDHRQQGHEDEAHDHHGRGIDRPEAEATAIA